MPFRRTLPALFFLTALAQAACLASPHDGARVPGTLSAVHFSGFVAAASRPVELRAFNFATQKFEPIGEATSSAASSLQIWSATWFAWSADLVLPPPYWAPGASGHYARVKATSGVDLFSFRDDAPACVGENMASFAAVTRECRSHRSPEAFVYTADYQHGPPGCAAIPATSQARYDVNSIPGCARAAIADLLTQAINRELIDTHWTIDHHDPQSFFYDHRRYLRRVERRLMVYGDRWLPEGHVPSWSPDSPIPLEFQAVKPSPAPCAATSHLPDGTPDPACAGGWADAPNGSANPKIPTPAALLPANVCAQNATLAELHQHAHLWHHAVHDTVGAFGGAFATYDAPAALIFWPYHGRIDDILTSFEACGAAR